MRIQLWQAFASNNSGSYTIVGRFEDGEVAAAVARELGELIVAHSAWHADHAWEDSVGSPLEAFARQRGLAWEPRLGSSDSWPEYGDDPTVVAVGAQLVVHAPYTITLPRTFGDVIRARGGVVEGCLDHAHHPLITEIEVAPLDDGAAQAVTDVVAAVAQRVPGQIRRTATGVLVRAVFDDLVDGVRRVAEAAARHGAAHTVRIVEAGDDRDPLGQPPLIHEVRRVILERIGPTRGAVVEVVRRRKQLSMSQAWHWLKIQPTDLGELPREWALELAEALRAAGAKVTVVGE